MKVTIVVSEWIFIYFLIIVLICSSSDGAQEPEHDVVTEKDLEHLLHILDGKDGEISWQSMMEHTTSNMSYQAWRHEPEVDITIVNY